MLFGTSDVSVAIRTFIKEPTPREIERERDRKTRKLLYIG
jgi:hypothetical protein